MKSISIIMPVLNEQEALKKNLPLLGLTPEEELIVVDGGSHDQSLDAARGFTVKVFQSKKGRAAQMNFGAQKAEGGVLLFLHADCVLPGGAFDLIRRALSVMGVSACAFDIAIDHPDLCFRVIERGANMRSRTTGIAYGDQGIAIKRELFMAMGGYADLPLMEDIEISRRLKKEGKLVFLKPPMLTSPRRWLREGLVATTLRDAALALSYGVFGVSPRRLKKYYTDVR